MNMKNYVIRNELTMKLFAVEKPSKSSETSRTNFFIKKLEYEEYTHIHKIEMSSFKLKSAKCSET